MVWDQFKDTAAERRLFYRRCLVMLGLVLVLFGILIARFYHLQVIEHETYTTLSDRNRVQVRSVPPTRGLIYDRNGTLIAENRPIFSVTLIVEGGEGMNATPGRLQTLLDVLKVDLGRFEQGLQEPRRPFQELPLHY